MPHTLLLPMLVLIAWTGLMLVWMLGVRIPAISQAKMKLDPRAPRGEQMATLPAEARWKADNYNHLMEQPTLFYATILAMVMLGSTSTAAVVLAWTYVGLRIVHSLVQSLVNIVEARFAIFALSTLALFGLIGLALQLALTAG